MNDPRVYPTVEHGVEKKARQKKLRNVQRKAAQVSFVQTQRTNANDTHEYVPNSELSVPAEAIFFSYHERSTLDR